MTAGAYGLPKVLRSAVFSIYSQHIFQPSNHFLSSSQSQPHFPGGAIKGCLMLMRSAISTFYSELNVSGLNQIAAIAIDSLENTMSRPVETVKVMALGVLQDALTHGAGNNSGGESHNGYTILERAITGCSIILKSGRMLKLQDFTY